MTTAVLVLLPILIAVGAALVAVFLMQHRLEVQLARERQALSEARVSLESYRGTLEELDCERQAAAERRTVDDFLRDVRVERRRFLRDQKLMFATRQCLVIQERLCFRGVPLCNWVTREAPVDERTDVERLAQTLSVFNGHESPARPREEAAGVAENTQNGGNSQKAAPGEVRQ